MDAAYERRRSVTIAPVTTRIRGLPVEVPLGAEDGLPRPSVANLDDITTVRISILAQRVSILSRDKMRQVEEALQYALALPRFQP